MSQSTDATTTGVTPIAFPGREDREAVEHGDRLRPKFDADGLIPCVVQDAATGEILMVAFMNAISLSETIRSGFATFWSRSRQKLWKKGESSGHTLEIQELLTDCDQDCLVARVKMNGPAACHTGHQSCFYRRLEKPVDASAQPSLRLEKVGGEPRFDPAKVYGH